MIRPHPAPWALWLGWLAVFTTATARAAAPDRRATEGQLEDQLLEGEIDAEDFLAWRLTPGALMGPARGPAYLGVEAFVVEKASGAAEVGAMLVLELPLERFAYARGFQALPPVTPLPMGLAQTALPRVERAAPAPVIAVTTEVARSCVRAALRTAGMADDNRLESVASRARASAALPELRLRAVRTLGESGRVSLSEDDPSRYVASGAATNVLEARVTFRLDRLLFADEEIVVERARLDRSEQRLRIIGKVLQTLFEWQKAYAILQDSNLLPEDRLSAVLREAESSAILDMMTGGWFGAYRAALAARGP